MKGFGSRRGSALLVVLGMMAFIIVSAVAFSAYMRYSRLPSSYLRRTSSSRMLVKAALAEAIEQVDAAIGNNPYPGIGSQHLRGIHYNKWNNRVFIGSEDGNLISSGTTVATLSMEGLAYVPPAFINEVRYYSRRTPTAEWQTLQFDAGRYAFCAVDVSDCLDVNRLVADAGRNSSDEGRITLSHCFENTSHSGYTIQPSAWDSFMERYSNTGDGGQGSRIPLVSVADLNLAINANGGLEALSPFCKYLKMQNNAKFVEDNTEGDATVELQRSAAFVTDTYFAPTNSPETIIDLNRVKDQPFYGMRVMKSDSPDKNDDSIDDLFESANRKFTKALDFPRLVQLYDYLDCDSVPITLALPTVERVPMVTSVGMNSDLNINVVKKQQKYELGKDNTGKATGYLRVTTGNLKISGDIGIAVGFVYPFKYNRGTTPTFNAQAAVTVTFVKAGSENELRRKSAIAPAVFTRTDWTPTKKSLTTAKYKDEKTPVVLTMLSETKPVTVKTVNEEEDAIPDSQTFDFEIPATELISEFAESAALTGVSLDESQKKGTFRLIERLNKDEQPMGVETFETTFKPSNENLSGVEDMAKETKYVPVVQVWVRILDKNNKVVDLVPACYRDDEQESETLSEFKCSNDRPVLRFYSENADDAALVGDKSVLERGSKAVSLYPRAYIVDDPRFNFAPECFKAMKEFGGDFKTAWLNEQAQRSKKRDGDIFMMTSDAGYLQSVYELMMLLDIDREDLDKAFNGKVRTSFDEMPAEDVMWRTWSEFKSGDAPGGDISRNVPFADSGRGFRVNPYTSDLGVMMAALANTPLDWWVTATNDLNDATGIRTKILDSLSEANKYTFSEHSGAIVQLKHGTRKSPQGTLTELAQKFMSSFRSATGGNWQSVFDNFDWKTEDTIAGVDLGVTLHSVDKKFLYGFWRECFANRQHLFLIFVRAEPMMMGGGGLGQTPPQLGARAVALVWRDPTPNRTIPAAPHRTRVLFYRQFD